ncbi:MAG: hypothetical protein JST31_14660 [Actinobacteria bacterium]|nr:hypothetical protein [Actinomycetota bacterium]
MSNENLPERPPYETAHISDIPHTASGDSHGFQLVGEWKQIRHYFGIREFGVNAFVATEDGQEIVHSHTEFANDDESQPGDEELYYIASGSATVKLGEETRQAPQGTLIFVGDPGVERSVTADTAGTTVLTFGTNPGVEFIVSDFEKGVTPPARWRQ